MSAASTPSVSCMHPSLRLLAGMVLCMLVSCSPSSPQPEEANATVKEACPAEYPECRGEAPPPMPGWHVPTDPQEKAAYDYAHSLPTPPSAPQPVPFDFKAARIAETGGGKSVAQQYFEHLCSTEAGEYITRRVENVHGFALLRPRDNLEFKPENSDRYGTEEPTGIGWFSDHDQLSTKSELLGDSYVQPLYGVYGYVEYVQPSNPTKVTRVERLAEQHPTRHPHGVDSNWRGVSRVPYLLTRVEDSTIRSDYAYTWRGLRRERDREFGIAGGEFFIIDRKRNEVLGMKRNFNSTFVPGNPEFTNWFAARECGQTTQKIPPPMPYFTRKVLRPNLHVNDAFVPASQLQDYHNDLLRKMEKTDAN